MSYERQMELEKALKHAKNYIWRLLVRTFSNSWQMVVTQQILVTLSVATLTTFIYIHYELIDGGKTFANLQALFAIIGITASVIVVINLLRAPFQLDREQEEKIQEKEAKIGELQITIKPQAEKPAPLPKPKNEPIIECLKAYIVNVELTANLVLKINKQSDIKAFLADFTYKPTENSHQKVYLRAEITFDNLQNDEPNRVIKGVWFGDVGEHKKFIAGNSWTLVFGLILREKLRSYGHGIEHRWEFASEGEFDPDISAIDGTNFNITVRLIDDSNRNIILNKPFEFELSLDPEINFRKAETV